MQGKFVVTLGAVCLALAAVAEGAFEIGEAMGGAAFWKSDPVLFVTKQRDAGFKFTSEDRTAADTRREGGVTYFGIPVYESRLSFGAKGGVTRVELTLFNRGGTEALADVAGGAGQRLARVEKTMTQAQFLKVVEDVRAKLTPKGRRPPKVEQQRLKDTDIRQFEQSWPRDEKAETPVAATLTWNYEQGAKKSSAFAPGFIRLAVEGPVAQDKSAALKTAKKPSKKWTDNVVRESRGDVFVDNVPMVDQGQKGYCAAAASERVLRYFGVEVDEHEIAVAASTSAESGTTVEGMVKSVSAIGKRYQLAVTTLYGDTAKDMGERIAKFEKEVEQYNKAAKKMKKKQIPESVYRNGGSYDPAAFREATDPEVFKEMKVNGVEKPKYMKFMKNVRQCVNAGTPLIWGVTLGTYPEADIPQARGGHIRLIIGYNDKKGEVLYSDTWGSGHELKRMPADWAWTITHSLLGVRPLK